MKRALMTGSQGFVGKYLRRELEDNGYDVVGLDVMSAEKCIQADILNDEQVKRVVAEVKPDAVFHLAGQADVSRSWVIPQRTFDINVIGTINLMEAIHALDPEIRTVIVGSSDQYGSLGAVGAAVSEETPMNPQTPYAVSKKAQEEMAKLYVRARGMNICMTRSFNHGGAGQRKGFLISDFASGIADIEKGRADRLLVGNLTARRDFTHVRDVVRAYRLLAEKGRAGEVYNVGSGKTYSAQEVLDGLIQLAHCPVKVEQDPRKLRPSDTPVICCDHSKITRETGWEPSLSLNIILSDSLEHYRNML